MPRTKSNKNAAESSIDKIEKVEIRLLQVNDYLGLYDSMKEAYKNWHGTLWTKETIDKLIYVFPEGQIAVLVNGKVVGVALSIIVNYDDFGDDHTYREITGNYEFNTHNPDGDVLYGIEVFVRPEFRGLRLATRLYNARKDLCSKLNLKAIVFGGRIPNNKEHSSELDPRKYIEKVKAK